MAPVQAQAITYNIIGYTNHTADWQALDLQHLHKCICLCIALVPEWFTVFQESLRSNLY